MPTQLARTTGAEFFTEWQQDTGAVSGGEPRAIRVGVGLALDDEAAEDVYRHWLERDGFRVVGTKRSEPAPRSSRLQHELPRLARGVEVLILDPWLLDETASGLTFDHLLEVRASRPLLLLSTDHGLPARVLPWARAHPYIRVLFRPDRPTLRETVDDLWMNYRRCSPA